jgi:hypothetical protein
VALGAAGSGTLAQSVDRLGHTDDVGLLRNSGLKARGGLLSNVAEVVSELLDKRLGDLLGHMMHSNAD